MADIRTLFEDSVRNALISFGLDFKIFWLTIFKIFTNADNENKGETVKK